MIFDFGANAASQARYVIDDTSSGWRNVALSTASPEPGGGPPDWSAVTPVRVALETKSTTGTFALGVPLPSISVSDFTVSCPSWRGPPDSMGRSTRSAVGPAPKRAPLLNPLTQTIGSVADANSSCRLYAAPADAIHQVAATSVSVRHVGVERWAYSFPPRDAVSSCGPRRSTRSGTSALRAGTIGGLPVMSLATGLVLGAGRHVGVLAFDGESGAIVGSRSPWASSWSCRPRDRRGGAREAGPSRGPDDARERRRSRAARPCLVAGLAVLAVCPLASLTGSVTLLGALCLAALAAMPAAVLLGGGRIARRVHRRRTSHEDAPLTALNDLTSGDTGATRRHGRRRVVASVTTPAFFSSNHEQWHRHFLQNYL